MYKNKIAKKLILYFAAALLIFSLVIGAVFMALFRNSSLELHKSELLRRAISISEGLSGYLDQNQSMNNMGMGFGFGGYGAFLRFIGEIAGTAVWVVDNELNIIVDHKGPAQISNDYCSSDLPDNAEDLIKQVFLDQTVFSEDFSGILSETTLSVGVPVKAKGKVVGAVLLHSPVTGVNEAIMKGFALLGLSIFTALLISLILSLRFSYAFTKPLQIMNKNALKLAKGDYLAKNNLLQKDEIGQLSDTLDILAVRLDMASRQSQKLEQLRRDFVANVSHELKTPVTVIRGSLEALADGIVSDPETIAEYLQQMVKEAKFLQRLIGDLLDLSRLQNTDFVIEMSEVSFSDLLQDVTRSAARLAEQKNIRFELTTASEWLSKGDYGRLRQMLLILLDNAIKFSPENATIDIGLQTNLLSIRDYGIGIVAEDLPYIFDRFYKSRSEQNKSGTGLGLAIAKQIAERHHLSLQAQNEEVGARFIVRAAKSTD